MVNTLAKKGIFLKIHWSLPAVVPRHCSVAWELSGQLVTLPVYPELNEQGIRHIHRIMSELVRA